jgi:hypothetical protein
MGLKRGAIGNTLGEHIENLRNMRERDGNPLGTLWEQRKNEKKSSPNPTQPTQNLKEK